MTPDCFFEKPPSVLHIAGKTSRLLCLLLSLGAPQWAATPPLQRMVVTIVNKHFAPARPVADARVSLTYFDRSGKITDALELTNRDGQTELRVSPEAQESGDLRIEVSDAPGLVIYQPPEGRVKRIEPTAVALLPKGSPALLDPPQIEAMLDRLSRLTIQNQHLQLSVARLESQKSDFDRLIHEWADANGLPYADVNARMQSWAADVLADKQEKSLDRQAAAELALRHFGRAALLYQAKVNTFDARLDRKQREFLQETRQDLRGALQASQQAAAALQFDHHFSEATRTVDDQVNRAGEAHRRFPEDAPLRQIWLWGRLLAEALRVKEGENALAQGNAPNSGAQLFDRVAANCQDLLKQLDKSQESDTWAYTELILVWAYLLRSETSTSREAAQFRTQAIDASQAALDASSQEKDPKGWAFLQTFVGLALAAQAARSMTDGHIASDKASDMLVRAAADFRAAIEVYKKADDPKSWASTKTLLAAILAVQGLIEKGSRAAELSAEAEAADREALKVFTAPDYPDDRASTLEGLGNVLFSRADGAPGGPSRGLWAEAAQAYREALDIRKEQGEPLKLANAQDFLGSLLRRQAGNSPPGEAVGLLAEAVAVFRAEAAVITMKTYPQRWARIQGDLGDALAMHGARVAGDQSTELLAQAASAYREAFQVFTQQDYPERWARTQCHLGAVLTLQGQRATAGESTGLLAQAVAAYGHALEVFTRQDYPQDFALAKTGLGRALVQQVQRVDSTRSAELLKQAIEEYRAALEVFSKQEYPREWTSTQDDIGTLLAIQAARTSGPQSADLLAQAAAAYNAALETDPKNPRVLSSLGSFYHEHLNDFAKAYTVMLRLEAAEPSDDNRLNLAEAALTTSRFADCLDSVNSTDEAHMQGALVPVRQVLLFACQWGAGQNQVVAQTADGLSRYATGVPQGGWTTSGDRKYLATAPEFASGREMWIRLFQFLEKRDGPSMAEAAHSLRDLIGH
jgi:hypothetical protein